MDLKVPPAGESISTVMISEWLVKEGDPVDLDQILVVLETDKINVEVPSPTAGVLEKILKESGQEADIGEVIAQLAEGAAAAKPASKPAAPEAKSEPVKEASPSEEEPIVSPAARRLMKENKLTSSDVEGSGRRVAFLKRTCWGISTPKRDRRPSQRPRPFRRHLEMRG